MKKTIGFVCLAVLLVSTAFAKGKRLPSKDLETEVKQVVLLPDLSSQMAKDLLNGMHPEVAVECREGTELPFKYIASHGLFSVHYSPNLSVKVEKTSFLRFIRTNSGRAKSSRPYISFDMKSWERLNNKTFSNKPEFNVGMSKDKSCVLVESNLNPQAAETASNP